MALKNTVKGMVVGGQVLSWKVNKRGKPHHKKVKKLLNVKATTADFHGYSDGTFAFHATRADRTRPSTPADVKAVRAATGLRPAGRSVEAIGKVLSRCPVT